MRAHTRVCSCGVIAFGLPKTFAKVENRKVAKLPIVHLQRGYLKIGSSNHRDLITKKIHFRACEGPRHHIIITIKPNSKADTQHTPSAGAVNCTPFLMFCTHAQCMSHDIHPTAKIVMFNR